jgi:hypothetical protein
LEVPASRPGSAGAPRRAFLRDLVAAALGVAAARPAWSGPLDIAHWEVARDIIRSGVIGTVRNADAMVPKSIHNSAWPRRCGRLGASLPAPVSDAHGGISRFLCRDVPVGRRVKRRHRERPGEQRVPRDCARNKGFIAYSRRSRLRGNQRTLAGSAQVIVLHYGYGERA